MLPALWRALHLQASGDRTPMRACVATQVAGKMGSPVRVYETAPESHAEIRRSCREAKLSYHDPTIVHSLNLQVAIAEERFDDACMCGRRSASAPCCPPPRPRLAQACTACMRGLLSVTYCLDSSNTSAHRSLMLLGGPASLLSVLSWAWS